ncbi:hypothetical protein DFJ73DRAFT_872657 [Zopfochytrium polystomum]|nr:hypothetical protein DFJ73DRAFT_872657 [Zopfochytrium polystomum]
MPLASRRAVPAVAAVAERNRDLILRILSVMPSQREARSYLDRYWKESPSQSRVSDLNASYDSKDHLALIRVEAFLPRPALRAFASTLVQLQQLGLAPILLLHFDNLAHVGQSHQRSPWMITGGHRLRRTPAPWRSTDRRFQRLREVMAMECDRVADAIENVGGRALASYSDVFAVHHQEQPSGGSHVLPSNVAIGSESPIAFSISSKKALVIPPLGVDPATSRSVVLPSTGCLLALAKQVSQMEPFAGLPSKLFLVNRNGGIFVGSTQKHVGFVNLADEYDELRSLLTTDCPKSASHQSSFDAPNISDSLVSATRPITANRALNRRHNPHQFKEEQDAADTPNVAASSKEELETVSTVLSALPPSSSAIIAAADRPSDLLANLLTDKPPSAVHIGSIGSRVTASNHASPIRTARGHHSRADTSAPSSQPHPVSINSNLFAALRANKLSSSEDEQAPYFVGAFSAPPTVLRLGLTLQVHRKLDTLDRTKLDSLLEASFRKKLHQDAFWERMSLVMDSVIVAGDYDGAAIVTAEQPGFGSAPVFYLDKFAVAPTRQGIGVADIVWKRLCLLYPNLTWRSRATNPVNKWYFDRSVGNVLLPGNYWMMFWYGDSGMGRVSAYRKVCESIPASFSPPNRGGNV